MSGRPCASRSWPAVPSGKHLDLEEIHKNLWERSDRLGRLRLIQKEYAQELGVTHFTITRLFKRMEEEGRMKKLVSHQGNMWTYAIRNPENFTQ